MDKSYLSVIESQKEPLMKQDKVEVNDTAHVSTEPESSCQNEVEKEYDIANKNIPQTTKSGTQQNNNQPGRETANALYRNDEAQSGNGRQAQPEQFENNTKSRKDEIPNQSLMDDSGQEHHPKQGQEAKNDTSTEENKNKTQTINDETAPQSASAEEGTQSTHSEGKEIKCQHSNSGVNVYINGEKNPPTSQESGTNQNQIGSDVAANASETPAKKPDSEESQLEKTTVMSEGQEEEAGGKIINPAINNKQNRCNETQDLPDENKTLPSHSGANETNQDQSDSDTQEKQPGNNPTTDQILTGVDHQQQQQPREGQETKRDSEKHVKDGNGDETQTTNNKTADSNNKDTSQNDPSEGKEPKDNREKVCKSKNKAQPLDPEGNTTNQEQSGSETQLNTEEKQSGNTQTTDQSPMEGGQQEEQLRKSSDAKSVPEDEKKDSNEDETQTTNNETADSANKDISQGGNPKENREKDSDSKAGAQPSDPEVSTTNQKKPGKGLTSVKKIQSGKSTTEDQSEQQELSTEEGEIENDAEEAQDTEGQDLFLTSLHHYYL